MADEALACFTSLLEDVPGWIADLENILEAARGRQQEIIFANQPATQTRDHPQKAYISTSLESSRSKEDIRSAQLRPTLMQSDALRLSQRKRKTASIASGDQSGPCKSRSKASAVLYYDGDTQKRFEKLVRAIGTSRNSIRKGKMSAKVDALSRTSSSSSSSSSSSGDEDGGYNTVPTGPKYKLSRSRLPAFGRNDGSEIFDRVDGCIEKAQSLCERAAHQVLRNGNCTLEVTNAKQHFTEGLKLVTTELPALRKKAEKAAERRRRSEEQHRLDEEAQAAFRALQPDTALEEKVPDLVVPDDGDLEVDILEVDDAESSSDGEEFNISSFKFVKSGGAVGGRFAPRVQTSQRAAY